MGGPPDHRRHVALRACGCALAGLLLLAGCSSGGAAGGTAGGKTDGSGPSGSAGTPGAPRGAGGSAPPVLPAGTAGPGPSRTGPSLVPELDEAKLPRTAAEARAVLARIVVDERVFGPRAVRATPFESNPRRWPVLDQDCVWQTAALPADVLATSTRHFRIPAADGHGTVRLDVTVTVHHDREESGWETARAMEEVLRCPDQRLTSHETLKNLWGNGNYFGDQGNAWTEDAFSETGEYVDEAEGGGPAVYTWSQSQFGPVTMAVAGKGAAGFPTQELTSLIVKGTSEMNLRAGKALAKEAP
ncbi:hypothetical protein [Streptomyces antimicrobicus]|uniref:Lipoprotein n=1 Tax=Streptomyces antimicrobicus TaxID=2883108 RepID=A0ABS8BDL6_9ACTN|nr:hypothetical protein [Streptomyces antimicrobicus]MCB5182729.1 hypothetical protein [Streptomyces antimicrobicus]